MITTNQRHDEVSVLFARHQPWLARALARQVDTSPENREDACMFAWTQLLGARLDQPDAVRSWLLTVAVREAVKLDRRARRTDCFPIGVDGELLEPADPRDEIRARELACDTAAIIASAALTPRQARILGLAAAGLTYPAIGLETSDSTRTVERQLLIARRKLRQARERVGG